MLHTSHMRTEDLRVKIADRMRSNPRLTLIEDHQGGRKTLTCPNHAGVVIDAYEEAPDQWLVAAV